MKRMKHFRAILVTMMLKLSAVVVAQKPLVKMEVDKMRTVDRNLCVYIGDEIIRVTDAYREAFENYCLGNRTI